MESEVAAAIEALHVRLAEAELRCKILAYALRGAIDELNPNARLAARRTANAAVLQRCPPGDRARRLGILIELFPDARDGDGDEKYIRTPD
jgi:hypothetical protein